MTQPIGPQLRTDIIDLYVIKPTTPNTPHQLLQLHRAEAPLQSTWQCVMGHIEPAETATQAAIREAREELNLDITTQPFFALEQVHPFFLPERNAIILSPRFAVIVDHDFTPILNHEHDDTRWVNAPDPANPHTDTTALANWMWPGQRNTVIEIAQTILADPAAQTTHPLTRAAIQLQPPHHLG